MINILSSDGQISFDEYAQAVHSYNTEQGLAAISQLSWAIDSHDPRLERSVFRHNVPNPVNQWQLAFFAKTLIERSNDYKRKLVADEDMILASTLYNNIRDPQIGNSSVEPDRRDMLNFLIRTAFEEFPLQTGNHGPEIARAYFLFSEMAEGPAKKIFDIGKSFLELSGLSVREFMTIGFAFWAQAQKAIIPTPIKTAVPTLSAILTPENQIKFLALVSTDYDGFRLCQEKQPAKVDFEKFQFNCLQTYPLIKSQRAKALICPIPSLLLKRFTRGLYYYLLDANSGPGKENGFSSFFGKHIFESYVGAQLKRHFGETRVRPECPIGKSELSCDWIIVEDDSVTLVECKTSSLTVRAKSFAETENLIEDLRRRVVSGVKACERTRQAILKGQSGLDDLAGKQIRNLIVIYDEAFFFNSPPYQELVDEELKEFGLAGTQYQVAPIADLEYVLPAAVKFGLGRLLGQKQADSDRRYWDISTYVDRLAEESKIEKPGRNTLLDEQFEALFGEFRAADAPPLSEVIGP